MPGGGDFGDAGRAAWFDKVPSKFAGWDENRFHAAGFRAVPGCVVRRSAYIAPGVVLMPSFVNVGAHVDSGTMIDTWATVGSCAQIGKNCHISGGAGIGGVLEPLQAGPVIIEDNCFIGARAEVAEGVVVEEGSVLSMGVYLGASTKIVDRATGEVHYGRVPAYSVVVSGTMPAASRCRTARRGPASTAPSSSSGSTRRPAPRPRSTNCCATELAANEPPVDPVELTRALIRCPSVTPADAGALDVLQSRLEALGFACHRLPFSAPGTPDVDNLYARIGSAERRTSASPATPTWCRWAKRRLDRRSVRR